MSAAEDDLGKVISLAAAKSVERSGWMARMKEAAGVPLPNHSNALMMLIHDPELAGLVGFNEFSCRSVILRPPPKTEEHTTLGPFPRTWEEADRAFVLAYLQRAYNARFKMETVASALSGAAVAHRFHPVREYLKALKWDGLGRISTWLTDAFGAPADIYHREIGTKFLAAAVQRVMHPGCKFDSMLILEGDQDIGKSRACRALFGDDWFTDSLPADMKSRDMSDALLGVWGIEFAEIEHLLRSEPETIKAFLSRQIERYRPSYGRDKVDRPRQCVFIGTTNSDDYARDSSGNRRLWPMRCMKADVVWIEDNRDQLWAEAAEWATKPLWLDNVTARAEAKAHQAERHDDDPWEDGVLSYLAGRFSSVTIPEVLSDHLKLSTDKQDKRAQMRVASILRRAGWRRMLSRDGGSPGRRWIQGGN